MAKFITIKVKANRDILVDTEVTARISLEDFANYANLEFSNGDYAKVGLYSLAVVKRYITTYETMWAVAGFIEDLKAGSLSITEMREALA